MQKLLPALLLLVALCATALYLIFQTPDSTADSVDSGYVPAEAEAAAADLLTGEDPLEAASLESATGLSRAELEDSPEAGLGARSMEETAWVQAKLIEPSGRAVSGSVLRAEEDRPFRGGKLLGEGVSGPEGQVRFQVPAGQPVSLHSRGDLWTSQSFQLAALRPGEELDLGALILTPADILRGQVLDPKGQPVADARVRLRESGSSLLASSSVNMATTTDAEGRFQLSGIPAGVYRLSGSAAGYSATAQDPVVVSGSGTTLDMDLQLGSGFAVSGVVLDADDRPVEGVVVSAQRSLWESDFELMEFADFEDGPGVPSVNPQHGVHTDARGEFTLTGLEEEIDTLMVRGRGYATQRFAVPEEGQEAVVHLARSLSIAGIVLGTDGEPVAEAEISLQQRNFFEADFVDPWQPSARTTSKADGTFVIPDLSPGDYRLTALEEYGQVLDRPLALDQDLTDLKVQMEPAKHLIVQVADAAGQAVAGAEIHVQEAGRDSPFGEVEINVGHGTEENGERSRASVSNFGGGFRATTDGSGRALLFGVPAGAFEAHIKAKGFADLSHAFERLEDAQEEAVQLTPATELVVSVLSPDQVALAGVDIYLKSLDEKGDVDSQVSDATGRAVWPRLLPGRYEVGYREASAQRTGMVVMGFGGPKKKKLFPVHEVTLEGGGALAVVVEVRDLALTEVLVTRNGSPAGGVSAWLEKPSRGPGPGGMDLDRPAGTNTDAFGRAQLPAKEPGKYTLVVRAGRSAPQVRTEVELVHGAQEFQVEIPGAEIVGNLFGGDGPMVGASLTLSRDTGDEEGPQRRGIAIMMVDNGEGPAVELASGNPNDATAVSDGEGEYHFQNVPAGTWKVNCRARGYERWSSEPFTVGEGGTVDLGTHRLMKGASLEGTDLGFEPSASTGGMMSMNSLVQLRGEDNDIVDVALIGPEGGYRFGDLKAGNYTVQRGSYTSENIEIRAGEGKTHDLPKE